MEAMILKQEGLLKVSGNLPWLDIVDPAVLPGLAPKAESVWSSSQCPAAERDRIPASRHALNRGAG